ncbi:nucleotidyltransferase family protein [Pseudomaricurvus alkylphenolicus]|jgi:hypothetical protein|uniref:nucleotidyltransferase domain-containing protein n=1 Tax=Pseudomaricurvus alkylphenolicus TaxID=1306991 RepID=UPI001F0F4661|nr:nucleotidyltransferase family protein [Pseudomaricurvus alkylphenolicus]
METLSLLIGVIRNPELIRGLDTEAWNLLMAQAYQCKLMGRLHAIFDNNELLDQIPAAIAWHFHSARVMASAHAQDVEIEIGKINQALKIGGLVPTFLKGAAYQLADKEVADGRLYSDVDIFVHKKDLPAAEHLLKINGWQPGDMNEYDQQYYRRWMHEIPPLVHRGRGTTLDVHHNLLPLTSRISLDADKLSEGIDNSQRVLQPTDRILHSIVHLLLESEFDKGIRDLSDIHLLIQHHGAENALFWDQLIDRALELGVQRLLFYAIRYLQKIFGASPPAQFAKRLAQYAPNKPMLGVMDWLFISVLSEPLDLNKQLNNRTAHLLMYLRGHWMRMPLRLLLPHLLTKAVSGLKRQQDETAEVV